MKHNHTQPTIATYLQQQPIDKAVLFEAYARGETTRDVEQAKQKEIKDTYPDLSKFREAIFWDTDIKSIHWAKYKTAVIRRVFERGNEKEIAEIIRFYGKNEVQNALNSYRDVRYATNYNRIQYHI